MSLTKCWECKTEVSNDAKTCPNCGARKPGQLKAQRVINKIANVMMAIGLVGVLISACVVGCPV